MFQKLYLRCGLAAQREANGVIMEPPQGLQVTITLQKLLSPQVLFLLPLHYTRKNLPLLLKSR